MATPDSTDDTTALTVCVYCASSEQADAQLRALAADVGSQLAERGWRLVYGGGGIGLMGEVSRAAMAGGGHVVGVIPTRLVAREAAAPDITELRVVDTMRERKRLMDELADAFLVLPGGIGTLEEFMEIITLRQLGYHDRAVILLDPDRFWEPLLEQFERMVDDGLATPGVTELFAVAETVPAAMAALSAAKPAQARDRQGDDWDAAFGA